MKKRLTGLYNLLSGSYNGNWQYRWKDTPFLEEAIKKGKIESIVGHMWGTMELWFHLRRLCPNLNSLLNSTEIYEILLNHDLGETNIGDTPLYKKIHGIKDDKDVEREGLKQIINFLPKNCTEILSWFDEFEQGIQKINRLEMLVSKWLDNLQGNHFALTFGKDLPKYSEPINKILQIRFVAYTNKLLEVLDKEEKVEAVNEVKQVAQHHVEIIKKAGIDFDISGLKI